METGNLTPARLHQWKQYTISSCNGRTDGGSSTQEHGAGGSAGAASLVLMARRGLPSPLKILIEFSENFVLNDILFY